MSKAEEIENSVQREIGKTHHNVLIGEPVDTLFFKQFEKLVCEDTALLTLNGGLPAHASSEEDMGTKSRLFEPFGQSASATAVFRLEELLRYDVVSWKLDTANSEGLVTRIASTRSRVTAVEDDRLK